MPIEEAYVSEEALCTTINVTSCFFALNSSVLGFSVGTHETDETLTR